MVKVAKLIEYEIEIYAVTLEEAELKAFMEPEVVKVISARYPE